MKRLWAPWRMEYILGPKDRAGCVLCDAAAAAQAERRVRGVLCVTEHAYVMLNRYPFTAGHLMVVPRRHVSDLAALGDDAIVGKTAMLAAKRRH